MKEKHHQLSHFFWFPFYTVCEYLGTAARIQILYIQLSLIYMYNATPPVWAAPALGLILFWAAPARVSSFFVIIIIIFILAYSGLHINLQAHRLIDGIHALQKTIVGEV